MLQMVVLVMKYLSEGISVNAEKQAQRSRDFAEMVFIAKCSILAHLYL